MLMLLSGVWARQVIVEVDRGPISMAPLVRISAGKESVELSCSDDGLLPDRAFNDDVATCAGEAPDANEYTIEVRTEESASWTLQITDAEPVQIRLTADGPSQEVWAVESLDQPEPEPRPQPEPEPEPAPQPEPEPQPEHRTHSQQADGDGQAAPEPGGGSLAWAVMAALLALGAGVLVGRSGRGRLPSGVHWSPARLVEVGELPPLHGAVLSVGEGPGLHLDSDDVLDVIDALRSLRAREPALPLNLVLSAPLQSPGEVGLSPMERLLADAPPGTTIYRISPN